MNKEIEDILKKIPDDVSFIPDKNLFKKLFFEINPTGDYDEAYDLIVYRIDFEDKANTNRPEDDKPYTFKYLVKKFNGYIEWWRSINGDTEEKYISKDDKLKSPRDWLNDRDYRNVYSVRRSHLSEYLFGGFSEEVLERKLRIFNTIIGKDNGEEPEEEPVQERIEERVDPTTGEDNPF